MEERLGRLERRCARLQAVVVALLAIGGWALLSGQGAPVQDVVTARRFVLVGADGTTVGEWKPSGTGAALQVRDTEGGWAVLASEVGMGLVHAHHRHANGTTRDARLSTTGVTLLGPEAKATLAPGRLELSGPLGDRDMTCWP